MAFANILLCTSEYHVVVEWGGLRHRVRKASVVDLSRMLAASFPYSQ